jgi:two-component system response regulator MprA
VAPSSQPVVLLVEDEPEIGAALALELQHEGYEVVLARDGLTGLHQASVREPDLVLLDVMLPGVDGIEVCRRLRTRSAVPILMLTARNAVRDRVDGLDAGADDYLAKPFSLDELLARVRAGLRRGQGLRAGSRLRLADVELDCQRRAVTRAGRRIELTQREFDLLEFFLRHPAQVLTRQLIFEHVWGYDFLGESNVIDVYVGYLRRKLDDGHPAKLLQTVRGVGYSLRAEP